MPSGLKWAKTNLGAVIPEGLGFYYSWGNIDGHPRYSGYDFSQAKYDTTPGAAISENLSLSQDAARAVLGAPWRMPTSNEFKELYDNCTVVWTTLNGVNGMLFTSNVNGNTLFIPAAGSYEGTTLNGRQNFGLYWSATYSSATNARRMSFGSSSVDPQSYGNRHNGFSIRAVQDGTPNRSIDPPTPEV